MSKELIVYSRNRATIDWDCPRKRYWHYEYGGKGVVGTNTYLELYLGTSLHEGLAAFAKGVDIEEVATAARKQMLDTLLPDEFHTKEEEDFGYEQATLVEGLLRGFYKHVWPRLIAQYPTIIAVEEPMKFMHDGMVFLAKPDLVVADGENSIWYFEYKSTSSKKENWVNSWDTAIQLHATIRAIEQTKKLKLTGVIVQGLYKGFESWGKNSSPFTYCYKRNANPPFVQADTRYEYQAGYKKFPVWEMEGGVKKWVEDMPENILGDQFPQAPPIFVKEELIDAFFQQRRWREKEIQTAMQMVESGVDPSVMLDITFPQHFDKCQPYFGKPCSYRSLCFGDASNPLAKGYQERDTSHEEEWGIV